MRYKKMKSPCQGPLDASWDRREFLCSVAAGAVAIGSGATVDAGANEKRPTAESPIKALYETLTDKQKNEVCFDWGFRATPIFGRPPAPDKDGKALPLRLHVSNAWRITQPAIGSSFFTREQQALIDDILKSVLNPGWPEKLKKQAQDDTGKPWGEGQSLAIFGTPGNGPCQCVITGFHLTLRATCDSESAVAFGGAIAHGHQPSGFFEKSGHPGNIFWHQAVLANKVYQILGGKQQTKALVTRGMPYYEFSGKIDRSLILPGSKPERPLEPDVRFRGLGTEIPGLPIEDMTRDQKEATHKVLTSLLEPYRKEYQDQVLRCLKKQGGLDKCHLMFFQEHDLGDDGEWDNWRLEGPAFVWYFRGYPHVHVWIHVADDPGVPVTSYFG